MRLPPLEDEGDGGPADAGLIRLQKVLARAGFGSRRVCDDLIGDHQVTVNGEVAELGRRVDPEVDEVAVHGVRIGVRPGTVWYLLNKPTGVVTTADDPQGRPTVVSMVPEEPRVFPVGRLDLDTEGLLLLTNDGDVTHRLTHPSFGVEKEYLAEVQGEPSRGTLRRLRTGVELEDGMTAPAKASLVAAGAEGTSQVRLTIHEGRNRQVRRMAEAVGHPVVRLIRTRIGPLTDPDLGPGAWRELTTEEVRALERAVAAAESEAAAEPDAPAGGAPESEGPVAPDSPAADDEPPR
jgi:23S rRNA pseudouridine2605 synthase